MRACRVCQGQLLCKVSDSQLSLMSRKLNFDVNVDGRTNVRTDGNLNSYVGCSESSCKFVISLIIFIRCTGKVVCVNFHLFLITDRKKKEK